MILCRLRLLKYFVVNSMNKPRRGMKKNTDHTKKKSMSLKKKNTIVSSQNNKQRTTGRLLKTEKEYDILS